MIRNNLLTFITVIFIIFIFSLFIYNINQETFLINNKPIEKTKLWGSLFSDNLPIQIQSLTNPPIIYDTKRIELIRYSDVLL